MKYVPYRPGFWFLSHDFCPLISIFVPAVQVALRKAVVIGSNWLKHYLYNIVEERMRPTASQKPSSITLHKRDLENLKTVSKLLSTGVIW